MQFTKVTGVTLDVPSGLLSLGTANPLTVEVSLDIENMPEEVVKHGASLKKFGQQNTNSMSSFSTVDPIDENGVLLYPQPGYGGRPEAFIAYPGRCLTLPNFPNYKFGSALLGPKVSRCEFYDSPACMRRVVLTIGKAASEVDTTRTQLSSFKCS